MDFEYLAKIAQIIAIDIVLSGDNAVVIAMAAHKLPEEQRRKAIIGGGAAAIVLRVLFTLVMAFLLLIPGVRFVGGIVLVWIACKLLIGEEDEHEIDTSKASSSIWAAIRMIFIADLVMSLDNMLAVAGASGESFWLLICGLLISIGIIMTCSAIIARLMNRFPMIVYIGAAILAFTAAEMIMGDRELAHYVTTKFGVSLNNHWEKEFMLTTHEFPKFEGADQLSPELKEVVQFENGKLTFIGQMSENQRDELLANFDSKKEQEAIGEMFETSRRRDVPDWVPEGWRVRVENWFQRRWPAVVYQGIQGGRHHYVAWFFYAVVVVGCLLTPRMFKKHHEPSGDSGKPEGKTGAEQGGSA